jgi:hypothetical protein
MKNFILGLALLSVVHLCAQPKSSNSDTFKEEIVLANSESSLFYLRNINGGLTIEGYDGNKVIVEMKRTIWANDQRQRERAEEEVNMQVVKQGNAVLMYHKSPCTRSDIELVNPEAWSDWGKLYEWNCNWRHDYDYQMDYTVKVPRSVQLSASTVNNGDILIQNFDGAIEVNNVNGDITLEQIADKTKLHTVNGEVKLIYTGIPSGESSFYTLNGDIEASFPQGAYDMFFESYNGDFYADIPDGAMEPIRMEVEETVSEKGAKYKIGGKVGVRVRGGGAKLNFETFNGDVFIKEK